MKHIIDESTAGNRIDIFIMTILPEVSRASIKKLTMAGVITVNGEAIRPNYKLQVDDEIDIHEKDMQSFDANEMSDTLVAKRMILDVVYEDEHTLVINKPSGINVHPVLKHDNNSLLNGIIYYLKHSSKESYRPRLVHRLDKDTSGILLVAKDLEAHDFYSKQFENRNAQKTYRAIVKGDFNEYLKIQGREYAHLQTYIGKNENVSPKRFENTTSLAGKPAVTDVYFVGYFDKFGKKKFSDLRVLPKTGRTHQIRVHLSSIGFPILGDSLYGGQSYNRLMLHAYSLKVKVFGKKEHKTFIADIPDAFLP